jgi:DNA-binding CsgD family transcriptional regulator
MLPTVHGTRAAVVRERIAQLADQGLNPRELIHEVAQRVRQVVPYDRAAWTTTDVETLLQTELVLVEPDLDCDFNDKTARGELEGGDANRFDALERSGQYIATLLDATGGDAATSARHRDVLAPRGLHDELRLLARSGNVTWGAVALARASDTPPFSPDECRFLASIASQLGRGLRNGLLRGPLGAPTGGAAGMLVLSSELKLDMATDDARRWLARMPSPYVSKDYLPPVITLVAMQAQAAARGAIPIRPPRARALISGEGWLHVRADVLASATGEPPRIGVMLEPAARSALQPLLFALYGLTARERAVTELLGAGHSTDHIASLLSLSRNTVRDHTKSIFAKTGVSSRPALTAALGTEHT